MKNKVNSNSSTSVGKPIPQSYIDSAVNSNPSSTKESFLDKMKHGLSEVGSEIKSHTIGEVEKAANDIKSGVTSAAKTVGTDLSKAGHFAVDNVKNAANDVLKGAEAVESGLLPSGSSIIMETGLAVGGLAIVALLIFKFV